MPATSVTARAVAAVQSHNNVIALFGNSRVPAVKLHFSQIIVTGRRQSIAFCPEMHCDATHHDGRPVALCAVNALTVQFSDGKAVLRHKAKLITRRVELCGSDGNAKRS